MLWVWPSVAWSFICCAHVSDGGWSAEALLQVPALIYVCGDACGVAPKRRPPYLRHPCRRLIYIYTYSSSIDPTKKHFFVGSILQAVAFLHRSGTAYTPAIAASMGWGGKPRSTAQLPTIVQTRSMWIESSFDPVSIDPDWIRFVVRIGLYTPHLEHANWPVCYNRGTSEFVGWLLQRVYTCTCVIFLCWLFERWWYM